MNLFAVWWLFSTFAGLDAGGFAPTLTAPETLKLDLNQAIDLALKKSPLRSEAVTERFQSVLTIGQGVNALLPSATATLSSSAKVPKGETAVFWKTTITIQQTLFDPSVFANLVNSIVNHSYYSTSAREKAAQLIYNVTTDYLNLLKSKLLFDATQKTLAQAEEEKKLTTERFRLGQVSRIDLLRSEAFYFQAQLNLLSAEKSLRTAQETFKATLGITRPVFIYPTEQITAPPEWNITDPDSLLLEIERNNPSTKMTKNLATIAALNLTGALLRLFPAITIYRSWDYSDTSLPVSYSSWKERLTTTQGIGLSLPLIDIKTFILSIGDAFNNSRRARTTLAKSRLQLRTAALTAILGYKEAKIRFEQARQNLELNKELHELALVQYRLGALPLSDLLEFQANLAQAEAAYYSALLDTYIQTAQIGYLLGKTIATISP